MNNKKIHIFDIDGCIMPNIFKDYSSLGANDLIEYDIEYTKNLLTSITLFEYFKKYYNLLDHNNNIKFFFITGRLKKYFWRLTIEQLMVLNLNTYKDYLIMYDKSYITPKTYYEFKIENINKIILENYCEYDIFIYDDIDFYYTHILKFLDLFNIYNIMLFTVNKQNEFWEILYNDKRYKLNE